MFWNYDGVIDQNGTYLWQNLYTTWAPGCQRPSSQQSRALVIRNVTNLAVV